MSINCNYGCAVLPVHQQVQCNEFPLGGISAGAFLECDHAITDFSSSPQWTAAINNASARLMLAIKGEIPAASPNMQDNPVGCGPEQILMGMDNTINITDKNVNVTNDDFYAKLNMRKGFLVLYNCEENEIYVSNSPVDFSALPRTVPMNNREVQQYAITATFYTKRGEIPMVAYPAPSGIFN